MGCEVGRREIFHKNIKFQHTEWLEIGIRNNSLSNRSKSTIDYTVQYSITCSCSCFCFCSSSCAVYDEVLEKLFDNFNFFPTSAPPFPFLSSFHPIFLIDSLYRSIALSQSFSLSSSVSLSLCPSLSLSNFVSLSLCIFLCLFLSSFFVLSFSYILKLPLSLSLPFPIYYTIAHLREQQYQLQLWPA